MVEPTTSGSTLGMSLVSDAADLPAALVRCFTFGGVALVERYMTGKSIETVVVEDADGVPRALPPAGSPTQTSHRSARGPLRRGPHLDRVASAAVRGATTRVTQTTETVHEVLGLRDLSRTNVVVDEDGHHRSLRPRSRPA